MPISWVDLIGYAAALLVFGTFYMKTMIPLRVTAILSNVAFIAYAVTAGLYPVLILHSLLLPLNCLRLLQTRTLIRQVREAARTDLSLDWLVPHMSRQRFRAGEVIFRKGDRATAMYLVLAGQFRLLELGRTVGPGALLGEIGVFSPDKSRMATAVCDTEVELGSIDETKVLQLYFQNPRFGLHLIQIIIFRLLQDMAPPTLSTGPEAT